MAANYQDRLKTHLSRYKTDALGVETDGIWVKNGRSYPHILPAEQKYENLLSPYREDLRRFLDAHPKITPHRDFHHLNSSQAMCLNLFFPLVVDPEGRKILTDALGHNRGMASGDSWWFEKVLDKDENTNFDFLFHTNDGATAFFEIKLSETGFGTASDDDRHRKKLANIYRPRLSGRVKPALLEKVDFFSRYQLCRNFSYLQRPGDQLFIVYPRANRSLTKELDDFLGYVNEEHRDLVKAIHLETLIPRILDLLPSTATRLRQHYLDFTAKYLPPQ